MRSVVSVFLAFAGLAAWLGCETGGSDPVVASLGDVSVHLGDLDNQEVLNAKERLFEMRRRYVDMAARRQALSATAKRRGMASASELMRQLVDELSQNDRVIADTVLADLLRVIERYPRNSGWSTTDLVHALTWKVDQMVPESLVPPPARSAEERQYVLTGIAAMLAAARMRKQGGDPLDEFLGDLQVITYLSETDEVLPDKVADTRYGPVMKEDLPQVALYGMELKVYTARLRELEWNLADAMRKGRSIDQQSAVVDVPGQTHASEDREKIEQTEDTLWGHIAGNARLRQIPSELQCGEIARLLGMPPGGECNEKTVIRAKARELVRRQEQDSVLARWHFTRFSELGGWIGLQPPPAPSVRLSTEGYPYRGPDDAEMTLVFGADLTCGDCARGASLVEEATSRVHGVKVKVVFWDLPRGTHRHALEVHEAARCAADQGAFWQFHDLLLANQGKLDEPQLEKYAEQLFLDMGQFRGCLAKHRHAGEIRANMEEAKAAGIGEVPFYVVNGRLRDVKSPEDLTWWLTEGAEGKRPVLYEGWIASVCEGCSDRH